MAEQHLSGVCQEFAISQQEVMHFTTKTDYESNMQRAESFGEAATAAISPLLAARMIS